jgi:membrane-associated phospholipid phosphatase
MTSSIRTQPHRPGTFARVWTYTGGWAGLGFRLGLVVLAVLAASQHVLRGDSLLVLLAIAIPGALLARRGAMPLAIYTATWLVFSLVRAGMDNLRMPDQGGFFAAVDRWLAGGVTPTERLQAAFYTPGETGILDLLATSVHTSYYLMPHLVAVGLWWYGRRTGKTDAFRAYLIGSIGVMAVGLLLYALLPTAPPWIQGTIEDEMLVHRITRASNAGETRDPEQVYTIFTDPNPIAAMPSLHTAITVLMAFALWRIRPALGVAGALYSLAMGFALIYLGEHYLVDVIAGAGLAVGVAVRIWRGNWGRGAWGVGRDDGQEAPRPTSRVPRPST